MVGLRQLGEAGNRNRNAVDGILVILVGILVILAVVVQACAAAAAAAVAVAAASASVHLTPTNLAHPTSPIS